jgi:hypothetical protein
MKSIQISDELHRHLQKYAMLKHTTCRAVAAQAIAEATRYGQQQLAVKWVPQSPVYSAADIDIVIGAPTVMANGSASPSASAVVG